MKTMNTVLNDVGMRSMYVMLSICWWYRYYNITPVAIDIQTIGIMVILTTTATFTPIHGHLQHLYEVQYQKRYCEW